MIFPTVDSIIKTNTRKLSCSGDHSLKKTFKNWDMQMEEPKMIHKLEKMPTLKGLRNLAACINHRKFGLDYQLQAPSWGENAGYWKAL